MPKEIKIKIVPSNKESLKMLYKKIKRLDPNTEYQVVVFEKELDKTVQQGRFLHAIYTRIALELGYSKMEIKEYIQDKFDVHTEHMDKEEMSGHISMVIKWATTELGMIIPEIENLPAKQYYAAVR